MMYYCISDSSEKYTSLFFTPLKLVDLPRGDNLVCPTILSNHVVMYSYGSPHMAAQKQDDQLERTFSSYVRIQVVVLKTYLGRWTIGRSGERGSGISVLPARYDDDDVVRGEENNSGFSVKWFGRDMCKFERHITNIVWYDKWTD